jgi:hypothetical protein
VDSSATDVNPEGLTVAAGQWAEAFKRRIAKRGLKCTVLDSAKVCIQPHTMTAFNNVCVSRTVHTCTPMTSVHLCLRSLRLV